MVYAITATADVPGAFVLASASGGTAGATHYLFRVDSAGVKLVRDAANGLVWPSTGNLEVLDHEARQGEQTDYILTDVDGAPLADVRVVVPSWGTWLKSPGMPHLNVRVLLGAVHEPDHAATRAVLRIEGSDRAVVLSGVRSLPAGSVTVITRDVATRSAVLNLLGPGDPIMIDTDPEFGVPYRYVSVGDVIESRPLAVDNRLGLRTPEREFTLAELVEVDAPIGPTAVTPGWTYESIPALVDAYVALPATFASYDALALG